MRLIDADRLKEEIVEEGQRSTRYRIGEFWELNRDEIWKAIDEQPTVEAEPRWIPCSERLPENDNEVLITIWDAEDDYVEVYKGFYQGHEWWTQWCHGCSKIKDEPCGENIVIAWMELPDPYRGGDTE